jgi:deazaflavin-dependent oxidoreductase (nitroreductase family)
VALDLRERGLWLLKNTLNRVTGPMARAGIGPFSLVRHVGRTSGRSYETPVILARDPEGFIAELTYGDRVNWYRNIVAAGSCEVVSRGRAYHIGSIGPCTAERGRGAYPAPLRAVLTLLKRDDFRLLRLDGPA